MNEITNIALLVFDNADYLDLFGPLEVFTLARYNCYFISTVEDKTSVSLQGVTIDFSEQKEIPEKFDLLLFPGGSGLNSVLADELFLEKIQKELHSGKYLNIASVCAGALILDAVGYLNGKHATTHWASKKILVANKQISVVNKRVVKDGHLYTSEGITAGMDLSLSIVEDLNGVEMRMELEVLIEYKIESTSFKTKFNSPVYDNAKRSIEKMLEPALKERERLLRKKREI